MAINLTLYSKSKDKVCIGYFGNCEEYLYQLIHFRSSIEHQLPGLTVYIACRDISFDCIREEANTLNMTQLRDRKLEFGRFHEVLSNADEHPIEKLLLESNLHITPTENYSDPNNSRCLIVLDGEWPTKSLTDSQVGKLLELAQSRGLHPEFGDDWQSAGYVWGVESTPLWRKAAYCQKGALLVPTGVGTHFYRTTFPKLEVAEIQGVFVYKCEDDRRAPLTQGSQNECIPCQTGWRS